MPYGRTLVGEVLISESTSRTHWHSQWHTFTVRQCHPAVCFGVKLATNARLVATFLRPGDLTHAVKGNSASSKDFLAVLSRNEGSDGPRHAVAPNRKDSQFGICRERPFKSFSLASGSSIHPHLHGRKNLLSFPSAPSSRPRQIHIGDPRSPAEEKSRTSLFWRSFMLLSLLINRFRNSFSRPRQHRKSNRLQSRSHKVASPIVEACEERVLLAAVSWDGGAGDLLWNNPLNWNSDQLPGPTDDVTINAAGAVTVKHDGVTSTIIRSLTLRDSLQVSQGSLTVSQGFIADAGLSVTVQGGSTTLFAPAATSINGINLFVNASSYHTSNLGWLEIQF